MFRSIILGSILSAALCMTASAQTSPGQPAAQPSWQLRAALGLGLGGQAVDTFVLVRYPAVQEELKLTNAQKKRVEGVAIEYGRKGRSSLAAFRERARDVAPEEVRRARQEALQAWAENLTTLKAETEKALSKALEPHQRTRLLQIRLQAEGPLAFNRPEMLDRLNLDPDQVASIQEIVAGGRSQMIAASLVPAPPPTPAARPPATGETTGKPEESKEFREVVKSRRTAAIDARGGAMQAIAKLLTKGQRANYLKMTGEPFDLSRLQTGVAAPATDTKP